MSEASELRWGDVGEGGVVMLDWINTCESGSLFHNTRGKCHTGAVHPSLKPPKNIKHKPKTTKRTGGDTPFYEASLPWINVMMEL